MLIQIIATSVETKPTAGGKSFQQLEVTFKNLTFQGKVEAKKIPSFGQQAGAFKTLSAAKAGDTFDITVVKNSAGYNDWTIVLPASADAPQATAPTAGFRQAGAPGSAAPRTSSYETPEERAQRQILIVRQSSVSSAVAMLSAGAKAPVKVEDVVAVAQQLSDFVFQVKDKGPSGFADFPDVPDFEAEVQ
jgi:hypothetical protein